MARDTNPALTRWQLASSKLLDHYKVTSGEEFHLSSIHPDDTRDLSKEEAQEWITQAIEMMSELQEKLYAQDHWALLLIFQAMDAAGKDGTIKKVMTGINPQGCQVFSFKTPSAEELDHDFLWRTSRDLPERGRIGIFNRSYYEEVLIARVHPEILARQHLPDALVTKQIWKERFEDIAAFERYLTRNGIAVRKFFLHVSKEEQTARLLKRLDTPSKNWKFSEGDFTEQEYWDAYLHAYEEMIRATSTPHAPWFVVPSDHKWFTHAVVAAAIIDALEELDLAFPTLNKEQTAKLRAIREKIAQRTAAS
ncbi:MAG: polyphosphate kinase 2 family protein [Acidobacteriaceae bacterium]|jgi:PPK2 family polyphosphate:nucleotide phosphotransferase|nr:polyphosphate kinase 2 family protein [Acidobacteriaceae bacterium]